MCVCESVPLCSCVCELVDFVRLVWHMREQGKDCSKCSDDDSSFSGSEREASG